MTVGNLLKSFLIRFFSVYELAIRASNLCLKFPLESLLLHHKESTGINDTRRSMMMRLLQLHSGTSFFKLILDICGFVFADTLLD